MRLALLLLLLLAPPALAQQSPHRREATIANETGQVLQELYLFAAGTAEGPDRLGSAVLPPRASLRVPLGRVRACGWEVRAVLEDGEELRRRFNLCQAPHVRLADTGPRREVELVNDGDQELRELHLSPPGSRERGHDRLGSSTVGAGEQLRIRLRGAGCVFDMAAVFGDDSEESRARLDLCRTPRLVFGDASLPLREVPVENQARRTIRELYARRAGTGAWGPDRLGASTLAPRGTFRLRLRTAECRFDLRAVFEDNEEGVQEAFDLCAATAAVFGPARATAAPTAARRLILRNGHARVVEQIYLSPSEEQDWGEDRLGSAVLPPGASREVTLEAGCKLDLRIVFDTGAAEERRQIDACEVTAVALLPGWTVAEPLPAALAAAPPVPAGFRLRNGGALAVVAVFADPPGEARGPNRLPMAELAPGEVAELAAGACQAAITAVFADGHEARVEEGAACGAEIGVE